MAQKKSSAKTNSRNKTAAKPKNTRTAQNTAKKPIRREVGAVVCFLLGCFTLLGYFITGPWLIDGLCLYVFKGLFGWGFYVVPPAFFIAAWILAFHKGRPVVWRVLAAFFIPVLFGSIVHLFAYSDRYYYDLNGVKSMYLGGINLETGGIFSSALADLLRSALSVYGALPLLLVLMAVMICISCRVSVKKTVEELRSHVYPPYEPEPEPEIAPQPIRTVAAPRRVPASVPRSEIFDIPMDKEPERIGNRDKTYRTRSRKENWIDVPIDGDPENDELSALERKILDMPQGVIYHGEKPAAPTRSRREKPEPVPVEIPAAEAVDFTAERPAQSVFLKQGLSEIQSEPPKEGKASPGEIQSAVEEISQAIQEAEETREYLYPPIDLLRSSPGITSDGRDEVSLNRERLEATLRSFGIGASISEITRGPTVTRYDLELEAGVKLNKLTNLAGDLALSLGVVNVRIAPIPDKISTVGVEVPNKIVSTVYLRDIIDSAAFRNAKSKLSFAVGKDIAGNCIVGNISKMPHMLIAGTTGSGKSVCMNSLILSLLYKATPEEVRLIMIDPKMVELGIYNGIPHLYIPVVTDPKKAAGSLQWAVVEMMKRYRLFSEVGVRDLVGYNNYMSRSQQPTMPNVVIVIDELADLMLTAAKEVEESICRVAQMGRAAGIHLVIATQRPSADVITGLMKANIPSRIAFAVSSALESRIILDQQGAEKLIGMGDMLYFPLGSGKPLRVQGAFVSDEERENVIKFIKERSKADYDETIMQTIEQAAKDKEKAETGSDSDASGSAEGGSPFAGYDELLPQAVEVLLDTKQASVSMLQRRLKLGYSRAARLVDQMEELGIVGPFEGSKPRQLLITREQWQEMSMTGNTAVEKLINESKDDFSEELS